MTVSDIPRQSWPGAPSEPSGPGQDCREGAKGAEEKASVSENRGGDREMAERAVNRSRREKDLEGHFQDILDVVRLLSSSATPQKVIETVLAHLCERLGKRTRCAFLEGDELNLRFWAGQHACPVGGIQVRKESIVWDVVRKGFAVNLTDSHQTNGYMHTLSEPIKIKAIIPLSAVDPLTGQEKKLGALIVDSGKEEIPVSTEDFEYLQVIGQLLSAIMEKADLTRQLLASCRRQEAILMETAHNFRNRIVAIAGFSRHITKLAQGTELAEKAAQLQREVRSLEAHMAIFERYMTVTT
jgi:GAF domain-containing protein